MQNKQRIKKNILKYKADQHKSKSTESFQKSTDIDAKPTVIH